MEKQPTKPLSNVASAIEMIAVVSLAYLWGSVIWHNMRWPAALGYSLVALLAIAVAFSVRWYGWALDARMQQEKSATTTDKDVPAAVPEPRIQIRTPDGPEAPSRVAAP